MKSLYNISKKNSSTLQNFIGGKFFESKGKVCIKSINPATQELLAKTPETTKEEFNLAVENSKQAFKVWRNVPLLTRQRYIVDFAKVVRERQSDLAKLISMEHGKVYSDALGEVFRGLEVVDQACNIAPLYLGETLENVANNTDNYSYRTPLGVTAGICPFNFPAMIPCWMFPLSIVCGNTHILKPSEKVALSSQFLVDVLRDIGLPAGVVNMVHGGKQQVESICHHKDIKAISFVGGNAAGQYIYETGCKNGKRVQSNMGAKNHCIVMDDADKEDALNAIVNASIGAAGQRCMALSVAIFVGKVRKNNI